MENAKTITSFILIYYKNECMMGAIRYGPELLVSWLGQEWKKIDQKRVGLIMGLMISN